MKSTRCPVCGEVGPTYAVSRQNNRTMICDTCGQREAMADLFPVDGLPRFCYSDQYTDDTILIVRGIGGYFRLSGELPKTPASKLNAKWGISEETVDRMVGLAMFEWGDAYPDDTEEGRL